MQDLNRGRRIVFPWLWRAILIALATTAIVLELPAWARAPLAIAAALVTVAFCVRYMHRRSALDRILTGAGVCVVALALLGLALNVLPSGLTATAWGIGVGVVELAAITFLNFFRPPVVPAPERTPRVRPAARVRAHAGAVIWGVLTAGVLAAAIVWATTSFAGTHTAPLAISGVPSGTSGTSGTSMAVTISSGTAEGPFDLVRVSGSRRTVIASTIEVAPGTPVTVDIDVHAGIREEIELVKTGTTTSLRELILDNRPAVTKASK